MEMCCATYVTLHMHIAHKKYNFKTRYFVSFINRNFHRNALCYICNVTYAHRPHKVQLRKPDTLNNS